jgi:hypothetical protein
VSREIRNHLQISRSKITKCEEEEEEEEVVVVVVAGLSDREVSHML